MSSFKEISSFKKDELQTLFKTASTSLSIPGLTLKKALKQKEYGRIVVVTPRKAGNAVKRNLIKRRLKAVFYQEKLYQGLYDCVIYIGKAGIDIPFEQLKSYLISALKTS